MNYNTQKKAELIQICKDKKIKGYSGKTKKEIIEKLKADAETDVKVKPIVYDYLETLKSAFDIKKLMPLILLYRDSQSECKRNGGLGMEVGMSREKDLVSFVKYCLGNIINYDIDNKKPEDFTVNNSPVSIKHSSGTYGSPVKAKWTSENTSVQEAIEQMINAEDSYYPNLLIVYLDALIKKITILCISSEENKNVIKNLKNDAFKIPKGNSRGIEYSKKAMNELLKKIYFKIEICDVDLNGGINPIERRIQLLKNMEKNL